MISVLDVDDSVAVERLCVTEVQFEIALGPRVLLVRPSRRALGDHDRAWGRGGPRRDQA